MKGCVTAGEVGFSPVVFVNSKVSMKQVLLRALQFSTANHHYNSDRYLTIGAPEVSNSANQQAHFDNLGSGWGFT
jgi:hypothetical protein